MTATEPITADPNDPAWHEARRTFIGASDAPAVLGISPWATPLDVWADKLNLGQRFEGNLSTDMGHALEELIRRTLADHLGRAVTFDGTTVRHKDHPHIAASVDGWVTDGRGHELAECKYVGPTTAHQWRNGVPVYVQAQCQVQMAVTGAKRVHVAALIVDYGPQFFTAVIERDDAVIDEIIGRLNQFWAEHIESGARPDTDGMNPDQVRRRLEQMYQPPEDANPVRLPHELATLVADIKRTKALKRDLEKQIAAAENELRLFMVDNQATDAFIDDNQKPAVTWRTVERAGYAVEPTTYQKLTVR